MVDRPAAIRRVVAGEELAWTARVLDDGVAAPLLRVWLYEAPALVLGRGQGAEAAGAEGLPVHVRPTGGGAVLVGPWMIGVSVVLPVAHELVKTNIAASYRWFGAAHARWLRGLGVDAEALSGERTQSHWACFAGRGPWEVEVGGRKIVGLAQARRRAAVLLSAGCLIEEPPWGLLCAAMQRPAEDAAALASTTVSAGSLLRRPVDAARWARSLLDALAQQLAAPQGALGVPAFAAGAFAAGAAEMTAAQRVCEMLRTEHEATRRDLAVLVEAAAAGRRGVPDLPRIRALMESVQGFERDCHAAKEGELLLPAVRVRSKPDADRLLRSLQQVKLGCDEQFAEAFELLGEAERRGVHVTDALLHALQEHRASMLRLMKAEEQLLYSLALRVLGEQDWLRLAADMWGVDHPGHALYRHETSAAAPRRPLGADLATH